MTVLLKNPSNGPRKVQVATDDQLRSRSYFQRLAMATAALECSRRRLIDEISDVIYGFEDEIVWPNGTPFEIPDIDEAFGPDGSFRWVSDFIRYGQAEPRQQPQRRVLARLRLIDLYFRIAFPERARLIAK
jgi:hypothetical protein